MNILLAGFKGSNNSAKVLLDVISCKASIDILYLENDFSIGRAQIESNLIKNYDIVIAFGQKPVIKAIYIETVGRDESLAYSSEYRYVPLIEHLKRYGYRVKVSKNAGSFLCNHVFFHGLKNITLNKLKTFMIFVHIPYLKNIEDIDYMGRVFSEYIDACD